MISFSRVLATLVFLFMVPVVGASSYQLTMSGSFVYSGTNPSASDELDVPIAFSGSFLFSPLPDTPPFISLGNVALYGDHPIEGQLNIGGEIYTMTSAPFNNFGIGYEIPESPSLFGFSYAFTNSEGVESIIGTNLYFANPNIINAFAFPDFFDLDDLFQFQLSSPLTSSIFALLGSQPILGVYDSIEFRQVPLPASLWLFLTALGGLRLSGMYPRKQ